MGLFILPTWRARDIFILNMDIPNIEHRMPLIDVVSRLLCNGANRRRGATRFYIIIQSVSTVAFQLDDRLFETIWDMNIEPDLEH